MNFNLKVGSRRFPPGKWTHFVGFFFSIRLVVDIDRVTAYARKMHDFDKTQKNIVGLNLRIKINKIYNAELKHQAYIRLLDATIFYEKFLRILFPFKRNHHADNYI